MVIRYEIMVFATLAAAAAQAAPIVIAHRGASGYLPEHTLEAKALAHGQAADFIEQDVVLTKDDVPVVLHDVHLDAVCDVADRFPERRRDDGRFYALDFTLTELRALRFSERRDPQTGRQVFPGRFPAGMGTFRIATLAEELEFLAGLDRSTGRRTGIYPEIKQPAWHRREGHDISPLVLDVLRKHGFATKDDSCFPSASMPTRCSGCGENSAGRAGSCSWWAKPPQGPPARPIRCWPTGCSPAWRPPSMASARRSTA
jgi:glycerophosphoryl diester phosphodiesterase